MKKYILNPISLFFIGAILGIISKLLDKYYFFITLCIYVFRFTNMGTIRNIDFDI